MEAKKVLTKNSFCETYVRFLSTGALKQKKLHITPAHLSHDQWLNWQGSGLQNSTPLAS